MHVYRKRTLSDDVAVISYTALKFTTRLNVNQVLLHQHVTNTGGVWRTQAST